MAVTIRSASSSAPDCRRRPFSVNVSIWSVTTDARPGADRLEQVAVGNEAQALIPRVVAGLEVRVDVVAGRELSFASPLRSSAFISSGRRRLSWKLSIVSSTFFQRTIA